LKRRLRKWLLDGAETRPLPESGSLVLEVLLDGKLTRVVAQRAVGLYLTVTDGKAIRMVDARRCADPDAFWRVWRRLSGSPTMKWADGTDWQPPSAYSDDRAYPRPVSLSIKQTGRPF